MDQMVCFPWQVCFPPRLKYVQQRGDSLSGRLKLPSVYPDIRLDGPYLPAVQFFVSRDMNWIAGAAHPRCCCASCIAGTLLEWRQLRLICLVASAKRSAVRCVSTSIGNGLIERQSP